MPTSAPAAPSVKQATALRQSSLVAAALVLAAQRSPAEVTTADLARAVGITQGAVFRHFENKQAIWLAVMDQVQAELLGALSSAAGRHRAPLRALRAVFLAHVDFVVTHPGVPRVIFQELQQAQDTPLKARVRALLQSYRTLVIDLLQKAQATGRLRPGADLQAAALLFIGSVQGLVMQSLLSGQVGAMAAQAPAVFDLFQHALALPAVRTRRPPKENPR
jgi:TetR/AcrR family transcriptional regulator